MTVSSTLMHAILAMDSYNRGYNQGITGLGGLGSQIGNATFVSESDVGENDPDVAAGFYAVAYNYDGETVISYRGADNFGLSADPVSGSSDPLNSWGTAK